MKPCPQALLRGGVQWAREGEEEQVTRSKDTRRHALQNALGGRVGRSVGEEDSWRGGWQEQRLGAFQSARAAEGEALHQVHVQGCSGGGILLRSPWRGANCSGGGEAG